MLQNWGSMSVFERTGYIIGYDATRLLSDRCADMNATGCQVAICRRLFGIRACVEIRCSKILKNRKNVANCSLLTLAGAGVLEPVRDSAAAANPQSATEPRLSLWGCDL